MRHKHCRSADLLKRVEGGTYTLKSVISVYSVTTVEAALGLT
jgi:hypothetical protein